MNAVMARLKSIIGEQVFAIASLSVQLEEAQAQAAAYQAQLVEAGLMEAPPAPAERPSPAGTQP